MKYLSLFCLTLLFSACNQLPKATINVKAPGIKNGTVILSQHNETVLSQPINNGEASIDKAVPSPGYYDMAIVDENKPLSAKNTFEVYLENNTYTIDVKDNAKGVYPDIKTLSKIQQELTDYYRIENQMAGALNRRIDSFIVYLDTREAKSLPRKQHIAITDRARSSQIKRRKMEPAILDAYITRYPDNIVAAHIMANQYLDEFPEEYGKIAAKLTDKAKSSDDGLKVTNKLGVLTKLLPGAVVPSIMGVTPDGKTFDRNSVKAKVILVEFWKSDSQLSEVNHSKMINGLLLSDSDKKRFAMLSVSTDGNRETWERAVKLSHLSWPQVADFKGDNSPNVANWMIKTVPTYFLVDGSWHLIKANVNIAEVDDTVHDYLKAHK